MKKFKVADWGREKTIKLSDCDPKFGILVQEIDNTLPKPYKLYLSGIYHSGYGVPLGTEDYAINLKVYHGRKRRYSEPAWVHTLSLTNDLMLRSNVDSESILNELQTTIKS